MKMNKDDVFYTRINKKVKFKFAEIAAKRGLNMSQYFDLLLKADFEKQGIDIQQLQAA